MDKIFAASAGRGKIAGKAAASTDLETVVTGWLSCVVDISGGWEYVTGDRPSVCGRRRWLLRHCNQLCWWRSHMLSFERHQVITMATSCCCWWWITEWPGIHVCLWWRHSAARGILYNESYCHWQSTSTGIYFLNFMF